VLKHAEEEQKVVLEKFDLIEARLAEINEFATNLEEHEKVSHDHMHRIEQVGS